MKKRDQEIPEQVMKTGKMEGADSRKSEGISLINRNIHVY